jgi:hypothetical protein
VIENSLFADVTYSVGLYTRSVTGTTVRNVTAYRAAFAGFAADEIPDPGLDCVANQAVTGVGCGIDIVNSLALNNQGGGFIAVPRCTIGFSMASGGLPEFEAGSCTTSDLRNDAPTRMGLPRLGGPTDGCLVYVPSDSNLNGAGQDGADIGANLRCQYRDGVLLDDPPHPLWDPSTGVFSGCGAVVPGVNDDPGDSCIGVHRRLNLGEGLCPVPACP